MKRFIPLALLFVIGGCATTPTTPIGQLNSITSVDVAGALKLAQAGGDQAGVVCWTYLGQLIGAQQSILAAGAATGYELVRLFSQPAFAAACGPAGIPTLPIVSPSNIPIPMLRSP